MNDMFQHCKAAEPGTKGGASFSSSVADPNSPRFGRVIAEENHAVDLASLVGLGVPLFLSMNTCFFGQ